MNITFLKDGEKKTYTQFFVKARYMRKALEIRTGLNTVRLTAEDIDVLVNFVVELFDNQFTFDDLYDGLAYDELLDTILHDVFLSVMQGQKQEIKTDGDEKK